MNNNHIVVPEYSEVEKNIVRNECLCQAVSLLTTKRNESTLVQVDYMANVKKYLLEKGTASDQAYAWELTQETIDRWQMFFKTTVGTKTPAELKIAFLCGPNPLNDLSVLISLGVLPENVWAFESEDYSYSLAIEKALLSDYKYIKIVKTDISNFLATSPIKFDLIYLDFCGPFPNRDNKQKNLATITSLFENHSLNSPGIIISNVALPAIDQDKEGHTAIAKLITNYLYPKDFLEYSSTGKHWMIEGPIAHGIHSAEDWQKIVLKDIENYYGQFITRLIMDMGNVIIPYNSFSNNKNYIKMFFSNVFDEKYPRKLSNALQQELKKMKNFVSNDDGDYEGGVMYCDPDIYSITYAFEQLKQTKEDSKEFQNLKKAFFSQLHNGNSTESFVENIDMMYFLRGENFGTESFLSKSMQKIKKNWRPFEKYIFCDVFLFHQLKELLMGQLMVPYHLNIEETSRWTYKAKDTRMFTDMLVFDECRYLYDWMPTMDMLQDNLIDLDMQLSFRFILDGISKHSRWYNNEFFAGTAVIGQWDKGFEAKNLKARKVIN